MKPRVTPKRSSPGTTPTTPKQGIVKDGGGGWWGVRSQQASFARGRQQPAAPTCILLWAAAPQVPPRNRSLFHLAVGGPRFLSKGEAREARKPIGRRYALGLGDWFGGGHVTRPARRRLGQDGFTPAGRRGWEAVGTASGACGGRGCAGRGLTLRALSR